MLEIIIKAGSACFILAGSISVSEALVMRILSDPSAPAFVKVIVLSIQALLFFWGCVISAQLIQEVRKLLKEIGQ